MSRSEFDAAMTQIVGLEVHGLGQKFGTRLFTLFGDECKESRTTTYSSPIRVDGRLYTQSGRQWTAGTEEEVGRVRVRQWTAGTEEEVGRVRVRQWTAGTEEEVGRVRVRQWTAGTEEEVGRVRVSVSASKQRLWA